MKGAQEALLEEVGNDFDLASLLISLYRASNIHTRYVYGTIEIPAATAMNWVGVDEPTVAVNVLYKNGIPAKGIEVGGSITKLA